MIVYYRITQDQTDGDSPENNRSFKGFQCDSITYEALQQHRDFLGAEVIFIWDSRGWLQLDAGILEQQLKQDNEVIKLLVLKGAAGAGAAAGASTAAGPSSTAGVSDTAGLDLDAYHEFVGRINRWSEKMVDKVVFCGVDFSRHQGADKKVL